MGFKETKNETYQKIKNTNLLAPSQLEYLSYLYDHGPCTNNELVEIIEKERPELTRRDLELFDRRPGELKKFNVIKVKEKRQCTVTKKLAQVLQVTNLIPQKKIIVRGKTKDILEGSMNAALLAVEIYNKPRSTFKTEAYITLMAMAWVKAFHAYYKGTAGDKYYYKDDTGSWQIINGDKKSWSLQTCINKFSGLKEPVRKNLEFFIPFRNKIEHAHVDSKELDAVVFGECQALLMNYESFVIEHFGSQYSLNENIVYSLQFSQMRPPEQIEAHKRIIEPKVKDLYDYVETYRKGLPSTILESQEYRINVKMVPVNGGASTNNVPVEFIKVKEGESIDGNKLTAFIKEKVVVKEVVGKGTLIHRDVYKRVNEKLGEEILTQHSLNALNYVFSIKPMGKEEKADPSKTNAKYCEYHLKFNRYQYTEEYVDLLYRLISQGKIDLNEVLLNYKNKVKMSIKKYS